MVAQDMFLRFDAEREENEIAYVRDMHLNTIRLEGKMMNDHFFETADRMGILVMPGWCCCSYWERWKNWKPEDYTDRRRIPARPDAAPAQSSQRIYVSCTAATIRPRPMPKRST